MQLTKILSSVLPSVTGAMTAAVVGFVLNIYFPPPREIHPSPPQGPPEVAPSQRADRSPRELARSSHSQGKTSAQAPSTPESGISIALAGTIQLFGATVSAAVRVTPAGCVDNSLVAPAPPDLHSASNTPPRLAAMSGRAQVTRMLVLEVARALDELSTISLAAQAVPERFLQGMGGAAGSRTVVAARTLNEPRSDQILR
ncbi:MAG: hypothetical protein HY901_06415 [Deltaproteobacteria bacterium]|nr:hypothetical protein [Deltaproteobacteria bacterium]